MNKLKIAKLSPTPLLIVLAAGALLGVPLRVWELCNCVDSATGLWATKDVTVILLYIICCIVFAIAFFFSFFSGVMTKPKFKEEKDLLLGICGGIFTLTLLFDSILLVTKFIALITNYTTDANGKLSYYLTSSGGLAMALASIFGILATSYLGFISFSAITGVDNYSKKRLLGLTPVLWAMFRLVIHFTNPINYRNVSQLFLEIMMLCFAMIFFMSFARISSEINERTSMKLLWFSGVSAALLAFICALAPFLLVITGKGELIPNAYPMRYCDLGLALFITSFLFTVTPLTNEVGEN